MPWKAGYRHYNTLLDVFFWISLFAIGRSVLYLSGVPGDWLLFENRAVNLMIGIPSLISLFGMIALILVRRLRDEYAERLWRQAAGTFVKFILIAPLFWLIGWAMADWLGGGLPWLRLHPEVQIVPQYARFPNPHASIGVHQFEAFNWLILKLSSYLPLAFGAFYKWHRWRDGRG